MLIRREDVADVNVIDAIHRAAFAPFHQGAEPTEPGLVRALRADAGWVPELSLVAEDADGVVVGHVVCTIGAVGDTPALGLGPLGVRPDRQREGIGGALTHAVLGAADALGHTVVVLLGHPDYYPRFGFVSASTIGITPPEPEWEPHFQARRLHAWTAAVAGTFRYAVPFDDI